MGEELFRCCTAEPETLNLAGTVEWKKVAQQFRQELAAAMKIDRTGGERQAFARQP
jgi:hypothetical protein